MPLDSDEAEVIELSAELALVKRLKALEEGLGLGKAVTEDAVSCVPLIEDRGGRVLAAGDELAKIG